MTTLLFIFEVSVNYIFAYSVLVVTSITQNKPLVREYFGLFPYFLELSSYYIMTLKFVFILVVCRRACVLFALCVLFTCSGVQHILCCVFVLFVLVFCIVYPMLAVSLDCLFFIAS